MTIITQLFSIFLLLALANCQPEEEALDLRGQSLGQLDDRTTVQSSDFFENDPEGKRRKVDRYELDDNQFRVTKLAIGLQQYLQSETPVVTFERPKLADWVEILRCEENTEVTSGIHTISLPDLELSAGDKADILKSMNFFSAALSENGCELVTTATGDDHFYDGWTPSNKGYRWVVRTCVAPTRLKNTKDLTSRNCSKQVSATKVLRDYVNSRAKKEQDYLKKMAVHRANMDQVALRLSDNSKAMVQAINECEEREIKRTIEQKKIQAYVTIAATALEVAFELATLSRDPKGGGKAKHGPDGKMIGPKESFGAYYAKPGNFYDLLQLSAAAGGTSFLPMLLNFTVSAADMPRTCARAIQLDKDLTNATQELELEAAYYSFYYWSSQHFRTARGAAAGAEVPDAAAEGAGAEGAIDPAQLEQQGGAE